jgi:TPR repeat protein
MSLRSGSKERSYADIVEHDFDTAKGYHTLAAAANQGFALSQNSLGKLYEKLGDVEMSDDEYQGDQNYDTAIEYYELAAKQGHADAQYNLAMMHEPDFEQMKPYLEQAANQHHPEAGTVLLGKSIHGVGCCGTRF